MQRPRLDIVIVNWNSGSLLQRCVDSISEAERKTYDIGRLVVVDNASRDDSAEAIDGTGLPLHLLRNRNNLGFAAGANQGAAGSRADYLLILNPDVRLFEDSVAATIAFLEAPENKDVAITGIQLLDEAGGLQRTCGRFPGPGPVVARALGLDRLAPRVFPPHFMTEWDHGETCRVDQVMGACLFVRRRVFEKLGGFDERFFVYFDDVDLCLRARQGGYAVVYYAGARAVHLGGGTTRAIPGRRLFYSLRSRLAYARKHFGPAGCAFVYGATLLLEPCTRLAYALTRASGAEMRQTVAGAALLWRDVALHSWRRAV